MFISHGSAAFVNEAVISSLFELTFSYCLHEYNYIVQWYINTLINIVFFRSTSKPKRTTRYGETEEESHRYKDDVIMDNIAYVGDTEATFVNQFYDNRNGSINNGFTHKYHSAI